MMKLTRASLVGATAIAAVLGTALSVAPAASAASPSVRPSFVQPGCTTGTGSASDQGEVDPTQSSYSVNGDPFGVSVTATGSYAFVSEGLISGEAYVAVYKVNSNGSLTWLRRIATGTTNNYGSAITPNGDTLLVTNSTGYGIVEINVANAESGTGTIVERTLKYPNSPGQGSIQVVASPDSQYAFVAIEGNGNTTPGVIAVFDLATSTYVGAIPMGLDAAGLAVSPNGETLYGTSEAPANAGAANGTTHCYSELGTLSAFNLANAESDPSGVTATTVQAGYSPVRILPIGSNVWVASRQSDALMAFSASTLTEDANVKVGEAPVGLTEIDSSGSDPKIVVADSDRFGVDVPSLSVVDIADALGSTGTALLGYASETSGTFPRDVEVLPNAPTTTVLVSLYDGGALQEDSNGLP